MTVSKTFDENILEQQGVNVHFLAPEAPHKDIPTARIFERTVHFVNYKGHIRQRYLAQVQIMLPVAGLDNNAHVNVIYREKCMRQRKTDTDNPENNADVAHEKECAPITSSVTVVFGLDVLKNAEGNYRDFLAHAIKNSVPNTLRSKKVLLRVLKKLQSTLLHVSSPSAKAILLPEWLHHQMENLLGEKTWLELMAKSEQLLALPRSQFRVMKRDDGSYFVKSPQLALTTRIIHEGDMTILKFYRKVGNKTKLVATCSRDALQWEVSQSSYATIIPPVLAAYSIILNLPR